jgi:hypothetical protein
MLPDEETDPCEVYFSDYQESAGRFVPHSLEVRHGDTLFGIFTFSEYDLQKGVEAK